MKVAAYCRVSTDKEDQINSLISQQNYFKAYIENHKDWQLVCIFADEGLSGTSTKNRKEFNRMIQMARNKELDLIITKEVSRFARNTVDTLICTRHLKEAGVGILFINDNIDTRSNEGEFRLTIMASVAQEESRKTSERVKWGQKRRMEQGVVFGNNSIYGYSLNQGKLYINEEQAKVVNEIYHKYVNEEKGARVIANELNNIGIKPKYANLWSSASIMRLLKNEKYAGDLLQKKYITEDFLTHIKKLNKNNEDMILIKNHHEAIITRELWNKAQAMILYKNHLKNVDNSNYSKKYWCSGKIFCGECGSKFSSVTTKGKYKNIHSWTCVNKKNFGKKHSIETGNFVGCNTSRISDDIINLCLNTAMNLLFIDDTKRKKELLNEIKSLNLLKGRKEIVNLRNQIQTIKKKKNDLVMSFLDNHITNEELQYAKNELDSQIKALQNTADQLAMDQCILINQKGTFEQIDGEIDRLLNHLEQSDQLYKQIVERIIIYKRSVQILFYGLPFLFEIHYRISRADWKYSVYITECNIYERN